MPLLHFMTETATTQRRTAPSGGIVGSYATYLEALKVMPVQLPSATGQHDTMSVSGLDNFTFEFVTYTESHAHTKSSNPVTELPDIRENDKITIDSIAYTVKRAATESLTSGYGKTLYIYLDRDNV